MTIRRTLTASFLVALATLWTALASAGTLSVRDEAHLFTAGDVQTLQSKAGGWPFDVHLLTQETGSIDDAAHAWVDGPNVVVIGLDPAHRRVVTRFGTGTGVKTGDYDSIPKAGNEHFRSKHWREGVEAIALRSKASAEAKTALSQSTDPVVLKEGLGAGAWFCIVLGFASLGVFIVWIVRRQRRERDAFQRTLDETREETHEMRTRNINEAKWGEKVAASLADDRSIRPVVGRSSPTVVVNQTNAGSNDLLTGYALGSMAAHPSSESAPRRSSSSSDSSSSSNYGSSSSSSSSYDSGGSSSSWDSGSSSSWDSGGGGGGFDGGGGSSGW